MRRKIHSTITLTFIKCDLFAHGVSAKEVEKEGRQLDHVYYSLLFWLFSSILTILFYSDYSLLFCWKHKSSGGQYTISSLADGWRIISWTPNTKPSPGALTWPTRKDCVRGAQQLTCISPSEEMGYTAQPVYSRTAAKDACIKTLKQYTDGTSLLMP